MKYQNIINQIDKIQFKLYSDATKLDEKFHAKSERFQNSERGAAMRNDYDKISNAAFNFDEIRNLLESINK